MTFASRGKPWPIEMPLNAEPIDANFDAAFKEIEQVAASVASALQPVSAFISGVPEMRAPFTPPVNNDFAWVNQGASSIVDDRDSLVLIGAGTGAATNMVARVKAAPATPYTITAYLLGLSSTKNFNGFGLCFRDSASGKIVACDTLGGSGYVRAAKFTSATVFSAEYTNITLGNAMFPKWFRIQDDGTNRIFSVSCDGIQFFQIHSIGRTDFLTANQVGFILSTENSAVPNVAPILRVCSWSESSVNTSSGTINISLAGQPATSEFRCALTGNIDDLDFSNAQTIRMENATLATIRGLRPGAPGQEVTIYSASARVDLSNQDAGETTPAARLVCFVTSGKTPLAAGFGAATLKYDGTGQRWRVIHHEQGDWITPTFAAGDYTANGAMTVTVAAGDVFVDLFYLIGTRLFRQIEYITVTFGGVADTQFRRAVPNGFTVAAENIAMTTQTINNGSARAAGAAAFGVATLTAIELYFVDATLGTVWANSVNNSQVLGQFFYRVV